MAESIINHNSRHLWSEIEKVINPTKTVSTCIDGVNGNINISELFSNQYNELYNSVRYEQQSLDIYLLIINMIFKHIVLMM